MYYVKFKEMKLNLLKVRKSFGVDEPLLIKFFDDRSFPSSSLNDILVREIYILTKET